LASTERLFLRGEMSLASVDVLSSLFKVAEQVPDFSENSFCLGLAFFVLQLFEGQQRFFGVAPPLVRIS